MGNSFGVYQCQKANTINYVKGASFLGAVIGYSITGIIADNYGRRKIWLILQALGLIGFILVLFAPDIYIVALGMFLAGAGVQSSYIVAFPVIKEVLSNEKRQKMEVVTQTFLLLGVLGVIGLFYFLRDWKVIFWLYIVLPLAAAFLLTAFFFVETPQCLVRLNSVDYIRRQLRFVASLNGRAEDFDRNPILSEESIKQLKEAEERASAGDKTLTYLDLFRFRSLRKVSAFTSLAFFSTSVAYFVPNYMTNQFGFNFYDNGLLIFGTELVAAPIALCLIQRLERRKFLIICSGFTLLCSLALIPLDKSYICTHDCWTSRLYA